MKANFIEALENHDVERVKRISKGDLHNHAPRGGNVSFIEKWAGFKFHV